MGPQARRAVLVLSLVNVLWGATFLLTKRGVEAAGGDWPGFLAARFALAAAAALAAFPRALAFFGQAGLWRDAAVLALPTGLGFALQTAGLRSVSPGTSAFLTSLYVPATPLAAWILFRERPPGRLLPVLGLALAGLWMLAPPTAPAFGRGELLSAACGMAFAFQIALFGRLSSRHDAAALSAALLVLLAAGFGILALAQGAGPLAAAAAPGAGLPLLLLATAGSVVPFWAMSRFQHALDPSHAAVVYALEPVFASCFSTLWGMERWTACSLLGAGLVLAANLRAAGRAGRLEPARPGRL